jgi:hypothetical protein
MTVKEMKPVRYASPAFLFLAHKRDYGNSPWALLVNLRDAVIPCNQFLMGSSKNELTLVINSISLKGFAR